MHNESFLTLLPVGLVGMLPNNRSVVSRFLADSSFEQQLQAIGQYDQFAVCLTIAAVAVLSVR